jgi:hypothetical protein
MVLSNEKQEEFSLLIEGCAMGYVRTKKSQYIELLKNVIDIGADVAPSIEEFATDGRHKEVYFLIEYSLEKSKAINAAISGYESVGNTEKITEIKQFLEDYISGNNEDFPEDMTA